MKVLIGAPVRQKPEIFKRYLAGLRGLRLPEGVTVDRFFVLHNMPELAGLLEDGELWVKNQSEDAYSVSDKTHHWTNENVRQVTTMKNRLLDYTLRNGYDYFLLVDSDLILHPETLAQLLKRRKDIIANIFWTAWHPGERPMPNAWDFDGYTFYSDSIERWKSPGCYKIGMSGACILISKKVIAAGVNYTRIPNLSYQLFSGEDRHFCVRAACHGFDVWLETTYPCRHLYRDNDLVDLEEEEKRRECERVL